MDKKLSSPIPKSDQATKIPSIFQISGRYICSSHADVRQKHFGGFCCIRAFVTSMFVMLSSEDKLGYNKGILALDATLFIMRSGCIYNHAFLLTRKQKQLFSADQRLEQDTNRKHHSFSLYRVIHLG